MPITPITQSHIAYTVYSTVHTVAEILPYNALPEDPCVMTLGPLDTSPKGPLLYHPGAP